MEINLLVLIDDVLKVKKYRCSFWANIDELKQYLVEIVCSQHWESENETYYVLSQTLANTSNIFAYTSDPVTKDIWQPIIKEAYDTILKDPIHIPYEDPAFVLLTESIYDYTCISNQLAYLAIYYMDAKMNGMTNLDKIKSNIEYYYQSLLKVNLMQIVLDDKYNDKAKLIKMLNNEWLECGLDYLYIISDGATEMSNRAYIHYNGTKTKKVATPDFDINKFIKKLNRNIKSMRIAMNKKDKVTFNSARKEVSRMINEFELQKEEFEKQTHPSEYIINLYNECDKLILEIQKFMNC